MQRVEVNLREIESTVTEDFLYSLFSNGKIAHAIRKRKHYKRSSMKNSNGFFNITKSVFRLRSKLLNNWVKSILSGPPKASIFSIEKL